MIKYINIDLIKYYKELENKNNNIILHCISNDWKLGKGIALYLKNEFNIKTPIEKTDIGTCIFSKPEFIGNLITKEKYFLKPTYKTLELSLLSAQKQIDKDNTILMPKIGCGLDKLNWNKVNILIKNIFKDYKVKIFYL